MKNKEMSHKLPTETKEWIRQRFAETTPKDREIINGTIETMKQRFSPYGLSQEELELAYFHAVDYQQEIWERKINIESEWLVLSVERLILMQVIATRSDEERQEICNRIYDKAMYRSDFIS